MAYLRDRSKNSRITERGHLEARLKVDARLCPLAGACAASPRRDTLFEYDGSIVVPFVLRRQANGVARTQHVLTLAVGACKENLHPRARAGGFLYSACEIRAGVRRKPSRRSLGVVAVDLDAISSRWRTSARLSFLCSAVYSTVNLRNRAPRFMDSAMCPLAR